MNEEKPDITSQLKQRILVLDGAMGTVIQQYRFEEEDYRGNRFSDWPCALKGNNDLLSITQEACIESIHQSYVDAGADIIETNTFSSTTIAMEDYQMQDLVEELNFKSAQIAAKVATKATKKNPDKPIYVAGSLGPTNKTASMSPDVNNPGYRAIDFETLRKAYYQQSKALIEGGADLLLVETVFDTLNAKAALFAIDELQEDLGMHIPTMLSGTITDASGRTLSGQTADAFLISMQHANLLSIGFNCALGADQLTPYLESISSRSDFAISAHPNAGLPNAFGEYDQTPEEMTLHIKEYLQKGLINIVGGCCGTTPDHIASIAKLTSTYKPRVWKSAG